MADLYRSGVVLRLLGHLTARERRILAAAALAIVAAVFAVRILPAVLEWRQARIASANMLAIELHRAEVLLTRAGEMADTLDARSERFLALAPGLMVGSDAASSAVLAAWLSRAAADAGVRLESVRPIGDATESDLVNSVAARLVGSGEARAIIGFLHAIESGRLRLAVSSFSVARTPGQVMDSMEQLRFQMQVSGLALPASTKDE